MKTNLTLLVFTLMNFVLAMTAFVFNGILDQVAVSLNISVANSGLLSSMYAYGAAFGVPITLIAFRKIERAKLLKIMLLITILTTLTLILAQDFVQLLIIRFVMGIASNSYGVLAISTVVALSTKERQGRSMAFLIMGSSLAFVVGIPLTRALSSLFDWRSIFGLLSILMTFSLVYFHLFLSAGDHESTRLDLRNELSFFRDGQIFLHITFTLIMFVGYGAFFTYVTPYLLLLFPALETGMSLILVLLGLATFTGNLIGGYVSDHIGYTKSMLLGAGFQVTTMLLLLVCRSVAWLSVLFAILWLMSAWFTGLQLSTGIAQMTRNRSSFMISLNSSSMQLGGAIGSSLAATLIALSGIQNIVFVTLLTGLGTILIQWISISKYPSTSPVGLGKENVLSA